jgi:excisionase family DNA binding protein
MEQSSVVATSRPVRVSVAARRLDINPETLYRLIRRGQVEVVRVGRSVRVPMSQFEPKKLA